jgi:hypothetical protein
VLVERGPELVVSHSMMIVRKGVKRYGNVLL